MDPYLYSTILVGVAEFEPSFVTSNRFLQQQEVCKFASVGVRYGDKVYLVMCTNLQASLLDYSISPPARGMAGKTVVFAPMTTIYTVFNLA